MPRRSRSAARAAAPRSGSARRREWLQLSRGKNPPNLRTLIVVGKRRLRRERYFTQRNGETEDERRRQPGGQATGPAAAAADGATEKRRNGGRTKKTTRRTGDRAREAGCRREKPADAQTERSLVFARPSAFSVGIAAGCASRPVAQSSLCVSAAQLLCVLPLPSMASVASVSYLMLTATWAFDQQHWKPPPPCPVESLPSMRRM